MSIDTAEIRVLRTVLRDLVALAAIPAALARREPAAVAAGLADTLHELFQLDFVFVRLRLPGVAGGVDVTRGNAWETFSELLARDHAESSRLSGIETFPHVDGYAGSCYGAAIPVGVNAEGGIVADCAEITDVVGEPFHLRHHRAKPHRPRRRLDP